MAQSAAKVPRQARASGSAPSDSSIQRPRWNLNRLFTPKGILLLLPDDSVKIYSEAVTVAQVQSEFPNCHVGSVTTMRCQLAPHKVLHHGSTYYLTKKLTWQPGDDAADVTATDADVSNDPADVSSTSVDRRKPSRHASASRPVNSGRRLSLNSEGVYDRDIHNGAIDDIRSFYGSGSRVREGGQRQKPRAPSVPRKAADAERRSSLDKRISLEEASSSPALRRFCSGKFQRSEGEIQRIQRQPTSTAFDICRQLEEAKQFPFDACRELEQDKGVAPWSSLPRSSSPALRRMWSGRFAESSAKVGDMAFRRSGRFAEFEGGARSPFDEDSDVSRQGEAADSDVSSLKRQTSLAAPSRQLQSAASAGQIQLLQYVAEYQDGVCNKCRCGNSKLDSMSPVRARGLDVRGAGERRYGLPLHNPKIQGCGMPTNTSPLHQGWCDNGPRTFTVQMEGEIRFTVGDRSHSPAHFRRAVDQSQSSRSANNSPANRKNVVRYGALDPFSPRQDVRASVARASSNKERGLPRHGVPNLDPLRTWSSLSEQLQNELSPCASSPILGAARGANDPYSPAFSGWMISTPSSGGYTTSPGSSPSFSPGQFYPPDLGCFAPPRREDSFGGPDSPGFGVSAHHNHAYVGSSLYREPRPSSRFARLDCE